MPEPVFHFKHFSVRHDRSAMKVGTDALLLGGWTDYRGAKRILDVGTGCGVLALIAAQRNPGATIDAVEIDDAAAGQAAENFAVSPWSDRLRAHRMDVRRMRSTERYDLVICNPPFYAGEATSADDRSIVARHGGELSFPELIEVVDRLLAEDGRFTVIIPLNRERDLLDEAGRLDLHASIRCEVRYRASSPPKRLLLELDRGEQAAEQDMVTVEESGPFDYSARYRDMLGDLLLKF